MKYKDYNIRKDYPARARNATRVSVVILGIIGICIVIHTMMTFMPGVFSINNLDILIYAILINIVLPVLGMIYVYGLLESTVIFGLGHRYKKGTILNLEEVRETTRVTGKVEYELVYKNDITFRIQEPLLEYGEGLHVEYDAKMKYGPFRYRADILHLPVAERHRQVTKVIRTIRKDEGSKYKIKVGG